MNGPDELAVFAIERACSRLVTAYTHLVDFGEASAVAGLFTADGVWESDETRMEGSEAIRKGFTARQKRADRRSRHVCTNLVVDVLDADNAVGLVYFTLYRVDGVTDARPASIAGPAMVGEYRDRFARVGDEWRIAHRRAEIAFLAGS